MLRGRRRKSAISMYRHRRGPVWSPKGSLALILPTAWAPSVHMATDGHTFRSAPSTWALCSTGF